MTDKIQDDLSPWAFEITLPKRKAIDPYCYDQGGNNKATGFNEALDLVAEIIRAAGGKVKS